MPLNCEGIISLSPSQLAYDCFPGHLDTEGLREYDDLFSEVGHNLCFPGHSDADGWREYDDLSSEVAHNICFPGNSDADGLGEYNHLSSEVAHNVCIPGHSDADGLREYDHLSSEVRHNVCFPGHLDADGLREYDDLSSEVGHKVFFPGHLDAGGSREYNFLSSEVRHDVCFPGHLDVGGLREYDDLSSEIRHNDCFPGHFDVEILREYDDLSSEVCDSVLNNSVCDSDLLDIPVEYENAVRIGSTSRLNTGPPSNELFPDMFEDLQTSWVNSANDCQLQTTRILSSDIEVESNLLSASESSDTLQTAKFGMYAGRVKANPLKYLATVLRSKLEVQHDHATCNLLDIATEIHNEAKNKHNTTLRRIYDVVNVLEAAGLLERSNGSLSSKRKRDSAPPYSAGKSIASECPFDSDARIEEVFAGLPERTIPSSKADVRRTARGSNIRWKRSQSENEASCWKQESDRLKAEKKAVADRISKKHYELEILREELRLNTELINHNRSHNSLTGESFDNNVTLCTPPPPEDHTCYLNLDESPSQTSETGSVQQSEDSPVNATNVNFELPNYQAMSVDDLADWFFEMDENDISSIMRNEDSDLQSTQFTPSEALGTGLHVPFIILQTHNSTNVDIELHGNETNEVYIGLDNDFKIFDYKEVLSSMFPKP